jgi:DNA uptake protein ComE-like DNA-binding protein
MWIAKYVATLLIGVSLAAAAPQNVPGVGDVTKAVKGGLIDLNSASLKQLTSLPGITSALANQIIKGRPFKSTNELVSKNILSPEIFDKIKNLIVAKPK